MNSVMSPTHDHGGALDVVVSRSDLPSPSVDVVDVDLSDHHLLRWSAPITRESPVYVTTSSRPWKRLNSDMFRSAIVSSPLCDPSAWSAVHTDGLAQLYDKEITTIVDQLIPMRTVGYRRRASSCVF